MDDDLKEKADDRTEDCLDLDIADAEKALDAIVHDAAGVLTMTLTIEVTAWSEAVLAKVVLDVVSPQSVAWTVVVTLVVTVHDAAGVLTITLTTVVTAWFEAVVSPVEVTVEVVQAVPGTVVVIVLVTKQAGFGVSTTNAIVSVIA